jgi:hypothetical protein
MGVNESLTDETFGRPTIEKCGKFGRFQSSVKGNWNSHGIQFR